MLHSCLQAPWSELLELRDQTETAAKHIAPLDRKVTALLSRTRWNSDARDDDRHGLRVDRFGDGLRRCGEQAIDQGGPRTGFDLVPRSP